MGFSCYFTLKYAVIDDSLGARINIVYAYVFTVLLVAFPIFCFFFYRAKFEVIRDLDYSELHTEEEHITPISQDLPEKLVGWKDTLEDLAANYYESDKIDWLVKYLMTNDNKG